jgi:O-antigen/teichoic acid export membrane protein
VTDRVEGGPAVAEDGVPPEPPRPATSGARARALWTVADQALSSAANAGLTIVLARTVSLTEYGAFALAFSVYSLTLSLSQGAAGGVVLIRYSDADRPTHVRAGATAAGSAVLMGALAAVVTCLVGLVAGAPLRGVLLAVGVLLPALVLQDCWRTVFFSRGAPRQAFLNDLLWVLLQAAGIVLLLARDEHAVLPYVAVWGAAAVVSALAGIRQNGRRPLFAPARRWFADHRQVSVPYVAEAIAALGSSQIAFVLIAWLGAVEDVGALRAAMTLLGPVNIVGFAASNFAVPEMVKRRLSRRGLVKAAIALSLVLTGVDAAWGGVLLLLPDPIGTALLGDTWHEARGVLPAMVVFTCSIGATTGVSAVTRALNRSNIAFLVTAIVGPLIVVCACVGVLVGGSVGAALGFALAGLLAIPPSWFLLAKAVRLGRRTTS